jgi:hypothetical protein
VPSELEKSYSNRGRRLIRSVDFWHWEQMSGAALE